MFDGSHILFVRAGAIQAQMTTVNISSEILNKLSFVTLIFKGRKISLFCHKLSSRETPKTQNIQHTVIKKKRHKNPTPQNHERKLETLRTNILTKKKKKKTAP